MDVYITVSTPPDNNYFPVDDLLDFSNDEVLLSSSSTSTSASHHHHPPLETPSFPHQYPSCPSLISTDFTDFTDNLSVPSDDVAELEWLSQFVDDSFTDFPANSSLVGTINVPPDTSLSGPRARSKRSRGLPITSIWTSYPEVEDPPASGRSKSKKDMSRSTSPMTTEGGVRRCTHCASEKTPQWRTGPMGPKTLCNACGVRYKSGRLVPEYRPAASPTFVLTQHSNSHRKVLELRRQKEMSMAQQQEHQHQHQHQHQRVYHHHHQHHDFEVC